MKTAAVSACSFHAGSAFNVIPPTATLGGTVRTFDPDVRDLVERRISEVADGIARAYGGSAETKYTPMYPATVNHERENDIAAEVARDVVGSDRLGHRTHPI